MSLVQLNKIKSSSSTAKVFRSKHAKAVFTSSVNLRNTGVIAYRYILGYALQHSKIVEMDEKMFFILIELQSFFMIIVMCC